MTSVVGSVDVRRLATPFATAIITVAFTAAWAGCGPTGHYSRSALATEDAASNDDASKMDVADSGAPASGGSGGSGGSIFGTGGTIGSGGISGTGGGSGGGTGGMRTGGAASGGASGTGGTGTGGAATGGAASGGRGTAGAGTGGAGTGGSASGGAGPRIISLDFAGNQVTMTTTERAGVKPAEHWNCANGASGSLADMNDGAGVNSGADVTWAAGGGVYRLSWTDAPGDTRMMNGYLDPYAATAPATVTVTGLPATFATGSYDVYVYVYGPVSAGTRSSSYTIGSRTFNISLTGPTATSFTGYTLAPEGGAGNYVVFRGITGSSFTLTAAPGAASGTQARAALNGLQIVFPSGS